MGIQQVLSCNLELPSSKNTMVKKLGHIEPAPTSAPWRMDDKWSGDSFLLDSSSLANHGGYLSCFFYYLPTNNNPLAGGR
jgi:hypothetical protein